MESRVSDTPPFEPNLAAALTAPLPGPIPRTPAQRLRLPLMIGVPLLILAIAAYYFLSAGRFQSTDDAYVKLARAGVSSSISGRVVAVEVKDNQTVHKGDVLIRLDDSDLKIAAERAEASYSAAQFEASGLIATYQQRLADKASADETVAYTAREAERQKNLAAEGVNSKGQADAAAHAADQAKAQARVAEQQVLAALADIGGDPNLPVDRFPKVLQAQAELDQAKLNVTYAVVTAPADGIVTKVDQVQVGVRVNASQIVFFLVSGRPWIEANFKEDQLAAMKIGQPVTISVDAYPTDLKGHVRSFSPGTGSSFSLLPPENATGNWVKVVQRLPVQIEIEGEPPALSAGLSATVEVDTKPSETQTGEGQAPAK